MSAGFRGGAGLGWILGRLKLDGGIVARSLPVLGLKQTWANSTQTFTGVRVNINDQASASGSLLQDWQAGGVSKVSIRKDGYLNVNNNAYISPTGRVQSLADGIISSSGAWFVVILGGSFTTYNGGFQFIPATNLAEFHNWTSGQTCRWYRTYTNSTNYEGAELDLSTNTFILGPKAAGTGTLRPLYLRTATTTVANLAAASAVGAGTICHVTDASSTTPRSTVAGGGSNFCQVMSDGTNWLIVA